MKGICFTYLDAVGHIMPVLPTVIELIARGHEIYLFSDERFKIIAKKTGAEFCQYPRLGDYFTEAPIKERTSFFHRWYGSFAAAAAVEQFLKMRLLEQVRSIEPDFCLYDASAVWGRDIAALCGIPSICYRTGYTLTESIIENKRDLIDDGYFGMKGLDWHAKEKNKALLNRAILRIKRKYGNEENNMYDFLTRHGELTLLYYIQDLQLCPEMLDESYCYVGGDFVEDREDEDTCNIDEFLRDKKCIYVSLGSDHYDNLSLFRRCIQIAKQIRYPMIISVGSPANVKELEAEGIPDNVFIGAYLPQLKVLRNSKLFITHGGTNSVMEAIKFCVPMVVVPQDIDEHLVAECVASGKIGVRIEEDDFMNADLCTLFGATMSNGEYHENLRLLSTTLGPVNGRIRAADRIEEYLRVR